MRQAFQTGTPGRRAPVRITPTACLTTRSDSETPRPRPGGALLPFTDANGQAPGLILRVVLPAWMGKPPYCVLSAHSPTVKNLTNISRAHEARGREPNAPFCAP